MRRTDGRVARHATPPSLICKLRDPAKASPWGEFIALYGPLIYRLARRKGLQDADAHDLCQDVFRAVARPSSPGTRPRQLSCAIETSLANPLDHLLTPRQRQPRGSGATSMQDLLEAQPAADPSATALFEAEYRRRLFRWAADAIWGEVTPKTWQAFWQTALEGRPPDEVAAGLGLSVGAVDVARSRVLALAEATDRAARRRGGGHHQ